MILFHFFLQVCCISVVLQSVATYVLLAANLDDFKKIAKKLIPSNLADQIANMASPTPSKYLHKTVKSEFSHESNTDGEIDALLEKSNEQSKKASSKKRFSVESPTNGINIDNIVEKVVRNLENEFRNYQNRLKMKRTGKKYVNNPSSDKHRPKQTTRFKEELFERSNENLETENDKEIAEEMRERDNQRGKVSTFQNEEALASKEVVDQKETSDLVDNFYEINMKNANDSYEDYVTPKKDKIYESTETESTTFFVTKKKSYKFSNVSQNKQKTLNFVKKINSKQQITTPNYEYSEEIKAKTQNLFDNYNEHIYDKTIEVHRPIDGAVRKKEFKGTMIPTKKYYKMNSPNYYAKLPIIAEKYNFDEPIPERDREPENLKYIGNPPARINRKIKL